MRSDRTSVRLGGAATLTSDVFVANPMNYTYSWTHEGILLPGETNDTLILTSFSVDDVGTYSCIVEAVGIGMSNITINLGGEQLQSHHVYTKILIRVETNPFVQCGTYLHLPLATSTPEEARLRVSAGDKQRVHTFMWIDKSRFQSGLMNPDSNPNCRLQSGLMNSDFNPN